MAHAGRDFALYIWGAHYADPEARVSYRPGGRRRDSIFHCHLWRLFRRGDRNHYAGDVDGFRADGHSRHECESNRDGGGGQQRRRRVVYPGAQNLVAADFGHVGGHHYRRLHRRAYSPESRSPLHSGDCDCSERRDYDRVLPPAGLGSSSTSTLAWAGFAHAARNPHSPQLVRPVVWNETAFTYRSAIYIMEGGQATSDTLGQFCTKTKGRRGSPRLPQLFPMPSDLCERPAAD